MKQTLQRVISVLVVVLSGRLATPNSIAEAPELRDVREAVLDTLGETPKSVFPAEGIPLRVSAPASADVKTWHFRTGVPFGLGAFQVGDRVELFRGERRIPVHSEMLATWAPTDSEFGKSDHPHSPPPIRVLTAPGAAGGKAISSQLLIRQ